MYIVQQQHTHMHAYNFECVPVRCALFSIQFMCIYCVCLIHFLRARVCLRRCHKRAAPARARAYNPHIIYYGKHILYDTTHIEMRMLLVAVSARLCCVCKREYIACAQCERPCMTQIEVNDFASRKRKPPRPPSPPSPSTGARAARSHKLCCRGCACFCWCCCCCRLVAALRWIVELLYGIILCMYRHMNVNVCCGLWVGVQGG